MAIVHTNFQDLAAFQAAIDAADAANTSLEDAMLQGGNAFSEFDNGDLQITFQSSSNIQGAVSVGGVPAGELSISGSNLTTNLWTINQIHYADFSPSATIDLGGSVMVDATNPSNPIQTGVITSAQYLSAPANFSLSGSINVQNFSATSTFTATDFSMHAATNNVNLAFAGNVIYADGNLSGTVTAASLSANGQFINATNLGNLAASWLDSSDAGAILAAFLAGNDTIFGDGFSQVLQGYAGNDSLFAGSGNDHLWGGAGADVLNGSFGYDFAHYDDAPAGFTADLLSPGNSTGVALGDTYFSIEGFTGSSFNDVLRMDNFPNSVWALDSDDTLVGLDGNDDLHGQNGNDHLWGGAGPDILDGGFGFDFAHYDDAPQGFTADLLNPGNSTGVAVGDQYFSIEGMTGSMSADVLRVDNFANSIWSLDGDDTLEGLGGNDDLHGQNGNDTIAGGAGDDVLDGGAGADALDGGDGIDTADYSLAGAGVTADLQAPAGNLGEAAGDTYAAVENLRGSSFTDILRGDGLANVISASNGNDTLYGRGGNDELRAGHDNDHLWGGAGADVLDGSFGFDFAHYDDASQGFTADLLNPGNSTGDAVGDQYFSIEGLTGSLFDDVLRVDNFQNSIWSLDGDDALEGLGGNDDLHGQNGNDTLDGGSGDDVLDGGVGVDSLTGGGGNDVFLFRPGEADGDIIVDFVGNGANAGDSLRFEGYGPGANFTHIAATNTWQISYAGGTQNEILTLANAANADLTDYLFV